MTDRLDRLWSRGDLIPGRFATVSGRLDPNASPFPILTPSMDPSELTLGRPGATFGPK